MISCKLAACGALLYICRSLIYDILCTSVSTRVKSSVKNSPTGKIPLSFDYCIAAMRDDDVAGSSMQARMDKDDTAAATAGAKEAK